MLQRKLEENLSGKMYFWGKIAGATQDYLIVHNINPFQEFPEKKYYYWYIASFQLGFKTHIYLAKFSDIQHYI